MHEPMKVYKVLYVTHKGTRFTNPRVGNSTSNDVRLEWVESNGTYNGFVAKNQRLMVREYGIHWFSNLERALNFYSMIYDWGNVISHLELYETYINGIISFDVHTEIGCSYHLRLSKRIATGSLDSSSNTGDKQTRIVGWTFLQKEVTK